MIVSFGSQKAPEVKYYNVFVLNASFKNIIFVLLGTKLVANVENDAHILLSYN